jgi:multiple sugar transport system permease protein
MSWNTGREGETRVGSVVSYSRSLWSSDQFRLFLVTFLPLLLFFAVFWVVPIAYALFMSLFQAPVGDSVFVGLGNYADWLVDPVFHAAFIKSLIYAVSTTGLTLVVGLVAALAVNQGIRFGNTFRTLMIFTYLFPVIVAVFMWQFILDPNIGILNQLLIQYGFIDEPIAFFAEIDLAFPAVILVSVWKWAAFAFFIVLARLQAIDPDLYERSKVMGATSWQMFRDITLPNLRGAILIILLVRGIWMFNKFDVIWLTTRGGPLSATRTLPVLIYERALFELKLGEAMALAGIMFALLAVMAVVYFHTFEPSKEVAN